MAASHVVPKSESVRRSVSLLGAGFLMLSGLLTVLQSVALIQTTTPPNPEMIQQYYAMNTTVLQDTWVIKRSQLGNDVAIDMLAVFGYLALSYLALLMYKIFKVEEQNQSDLPAFTTGFFLMGAFLPSWAVLTQAGVTTAAATVARWPLPPVGWQILEISTIIAAGRGIYTVSIQFVAISIGLCLYHHLNVRCNYPLSKHHSRFGIAVACWGFIAFFAEIAILNTLAPAKEGELVRPGLAEAYTIFAIAVLFFAFLFLPIWMVWLGVLLTRHKNAQRLAAAEKLTILAPAVEDPPVSPVVPALNNSEAATALPPRIALRLQNGLFLTANEATVVAAAESSDPIQVWTVSIVGARTVALKSHHGFFLTPQPEGNLQFNRDTIGPWERLSVEVVPTADGTKCVAFKTAHNSYLGGEPSGRISAGRTSVGPWEQFVVLEK